MKVSNWYLEKIKNYFTKVVTVERIVTVPIYQKKGEVTISDIVWIVTRELKVKPVKKNVDYHNSRIIEFWNNLPIKVYDQQCLRAFYDEQSAKEWLCKELDRRKKENNCR